MNNKEINTFLQELSFLITDLEIQQTTKKLQRFMHKVLLRFEENLTGNDKKNNQKYIKELKNRVLAIIPIDNQLLSKIKDLIEDHEMLESIIKVLKEELEDGN